MEKDHSDKLQDLLRRDKEVLELECEKLRKELLSVNATVGGSACMHVCMYVCMIVETSEQAVVMIVMWCYDS
jgi:hypothetical protein